KLQAANKAYLGVGGPFTVQADAAKKQLQQQLKGFPELSKLDITDEKQLERLLALTKEADQAADKRIQQIELEKTSSKELLNIIVDETQTEDKRIAAKSALVKVLQDEAKAHGTTAAAIADKAIADEKQTEASLENTRAKILAEQQYQV